MEDLISNPWIVGLIGWIAFTVTNLSLDKDLKDEHDQAFPMIPYFKKNWDNWLRSLVFIPVLVVVGKYGAEFQSTAGIEWSDLYYLSAGIAPEFAINKYKAWKSKV
jgi:hypothetical protein